MRARRTYTGDREGVGRSTTILLMSVELERDGVSYGAVICNDETENPLVEHIEPPVWLCVGKRGVAPPRCHLRSTAGDAASTRKETMHLLAVFPESELVACGVCEVESRASERHCCN